MTGNKKNLTREDIERLIGKLDAELAHRGHRAVLYVVGGANIAMAVDDSRTTTDIDVVVKQGFNVIFSAARAVARSEAGIGEDWINAGFTGGIPAGGITWPWFDNWDGDTPITAFKGSALHVELASLEMMLALKTLAQRPQDMDDIYTLMRMTGIKTPDGVGRNLAHFTGTRIFDAQGQPGMFIHIDPKFRSIFDGAPEDLRPLGYTRRRPVKTRVRGWLDERRSASAERKRQLQEEAGRRKFAADASPKCGAIKVTSRGSIEISRTKPCSRAQGHKGKHHFSGGR